MKLRRRLRFTKKYRMIFQYGTFKRLKNGWQVKREKTAIAGVFRRQVSAAPGYEQLCLKDLDKKKQYQFTTREQKLRVGQFGALIKHVVPVNLNPNGMILRTADRLLTMPDGDQSLRASGSALMAGVRLLPLFRGTGYAPDQRTLTDFGSELYIIEEETKNEND